MDYVNQPMITYIGNKRKLVSWILDVIRGIPGDGLRVLDGFAGSGVVSRALRSARSASSAPLCSILHSNDLEYYSHLLLRCYLETPSPDQQARIQQHATRMQFEVHGVLDGLLDGVPYEGFVSRLYAPRNTAHPVDGERCFYTHENALLIDGMLHYIFGVEEDIRHWLLGPLLVQASIHVNTAGVFRGFYKKDGIGHFGGSGENALERILTPIQWTLPIWDTTPTEVHCHQSDTTALVKGFADASLDVIYLDPPYNEHPYGSNYFMLNLLARNEEPVEMSRVSGIPKGWNTSPFNGRGKALGAMRELLRECLRVARYVLVSYNNEGLITDAQWTALIEELGCRSEVHEHVYDAYHGSRNRAARAHHVAERIYRLSGAR